MFFMTKRLAKEIPKRSRFRKNFLRNRTKEIIIGKGLTVYIFCRNIRADTIL